MVFCYHLAKGVNLLNRRFFLVLCDEVEIVLSLKIENGAHVRDQLTFLSLLFNWLVSRQVVLFLITLGIYGSY